MHQEDGTGRTSHDSKFSCILVRSLSFLLCFLFPLCPVSGQLPGDQGARSGGSQTVAPSAVRASISIWRRGPERGSESVDEDGCRAGSVPWPAMDGGHIDIGKSCATRDPHCYTGHRQALSDVVCMRENGWVQRHVVCASLAVWVSWPGWSGTRTLWSWPICVHPSCEDWRRDVINARTTLELRSCRDNIAARHRRDEAACITLFVVRLLNPQPTPIPHISNSATR